MGGSSSALKTRGLYSHYKWSPDELRHFIETKRLSPLHDGSDDPILPSTIFCEICYRYYPFVNITTCCHRQICSECIAASCPVPPDPISCPFCRQNNISWSPNVTHGVTNQDSEEYRLFLEKQLRGEADVALIETRKLPDALETQALEISKSYNVNLNTLRDLLAAGLTAEEILTQFAAS
jgi:hypothetical protein